MKKVRVRFISDAVYRVAGYSHPKNPVFRTGDEHEFREDVAARWIKRGVAVIKTSDNPVKATETVRVDTVPAAPAEAPSAIDGLDAGDKPAADDGGEGQAKHRRGRRGE